MAGSVFGRRDWLLLAKEEKGHLFSTWYYWRAVQLACQAIGHELSMIGALYHDGFGWLVTQGALSAPAKKILALLEKDDVLIDEIVRRNEQLIPLMLKDAEWFRSVDLKSQSGKVLFEHWRAWHESFLAMMPYSVLGTILEFEEPLLSDRIMRQLTSLVGEGLAGDYFSTLTLVTKLTSANIEELDLLRLRLRQLAGGDIRDDLRRHHERYAWVIYNYDGPARTFEEVQKRFSSLPDAAVEVEQRLDAVVRAPVVNAQKQQAVLENLPADEELLRLIGALRTLGYWKYERKLLNTKAHWLIELLLAELARRLDLSLDEAKMILPDEMEAALVKGKVDRVLLRSRCSLAFGVYRGNSSYDCFAGMEAKRLLADLEESTKVDESLSELKGSTAYKGSATGQVRVVNSPEEMVGFEKGDILISASTSPAILPVMKLARAIVTDSGGITCHAAIVARELQVPTLIGTKCASKLFKNGERVFVDATKGLIRRVS